MTNADFGYIGRDGVTIYRNCFRIYNEARLKNWKNQKLEKPEEEWSKLIPETEEVFFFLVEEGIKNGFNIDNILEIPDSMGDTCFGAASLCSEKICNYIIGRRIEINSINTRMMVPTFDYPNLAVQMMKMGINPHVINYEGYSQVDYNPSSFESEEAKVLLSKFPRSVHFSIKDIKCKY